jgi:hypothetical protein
VCPPPPRGAGSGGSSGGKGAPAAAPRTLLLRVDDYGPSVYLPAPLVQAGDDGGGAREPAPADLARLLQVLNSRCGGASLVGLVSGRLERRARLSYSGAGPPPGISRPSCAEPASPTQLSPSQRARLPADARAAKADLVTARPIMYFRPAAPGGQPFVKFTLKPGGNFKKASGGRRRGEAAGTGQGERDRRQLGVRNTCICPDHACPPPHPPRGRR